MSVFCRSCGALNVDNASACTRCGGVMHGVVHSQPENNLALAIAVTVLCCLPFGVVGIVYAAQVNPMAQTGNFAAAEELARKARFWSFVGLGVGGLGAGTYVLLMLLGVAAGLMKH